ncbi:hypothetical protein E2C01_073194 [Portunus trituberculatus]|uniref:CCHC-type domain-containing protein n=1 Tax=Portunus trituberculatus TaxID=210409 RepID=A0A5B7I269_PORTR|nr:hypothetical protein [Portunus trituberculatus]
MIFDQFLASLNPDICTFIKEHRPSSLVRAVKLADDWASAHYTSKPSFRSSPSFFKSPLKKTPPVHSSPLPTSSTTRCHGCGELGHIRPRCPKNPRAFKEYPPSQPFMDSMPLVTSSLCAVETRASTPRMKRLHPLHLPDLQPLSVTPEDL